VTPNDITAVVVIGVLLFLVLCAVARRGQAR
jgi:hypothetical protein